MFFLPFTDGKVRSSYSNVSSSWMSSIPTAVHCGPEGNNTDTLFLQYNLKTSCGWCKRLQCQKQGLQQKSEVYDAFHQI